ncbi:MAG: lipid IV(A) palmitoyltransferase PagP [Burkholderiales bacterium]|nr:lipid IV(A) palmitoyltransferase PagP [Burkholderiales bacterium]
MEASSLSTLRTGFLALFLSLCTLVPAHAACDDTTSISGQICKRLTDTWNEGEHDLYLPFHTFHLPYAYSDEAINTYRENTWGLGYGRSRHDESGSWNGLYGMLFLDSHSKLQPIVGYGHQWLWGPREGLHAGLGYTVFVTARADIRSYTPIPAVLPIASINYGKVAVNAAFMPGGMGFGNILFLWGRVGF